MARNKTRSNSPIVWFIVIDNDQFSGADLPPPQRSISRTLISPDTKFGHVLSIDESRQSIHFDSSASSRDHDGGWLVRDNRCTVRPAFNTYFAWVAPLQTATSASPPVGQGVVGAKGIIAK